MPEQDQFRYGEYPIGVSPDKISSKRELDLEVSVLVKELYRRPSSERKIFLADYIRQMEDLPRIDFDDRMQTLREAVKRGKFIFDLRDAHAILEEEKRDSEEPPRGRLRR